MSNLAPKKSCNEVALEKAKRKKEKKTAPQVPVVKAGVKVRRENYATVLLRRDDSSSESLSELDPSDSLSEPNSSSSGGGF